MIQSYRWHIVDSNMDVYIYDDIPVRSVSKIMKLLKDEFDISSDEIEVDWHTDRNCGYITQEFYSPIDKVKLNG